MASDSTAAKTVPVSAGVPEAQRFQHLGSEEPESALGALTFAAVSGCAGVTALYQGCGPWTAGLGALNLILYTSFYTPLKRRHIINTWVGSVVGAIPPVMGWTAATGTLNTATSLASAVTETAAVSIVTSSSSEKGAIVQTCWP
ncbi:protoheme IX farnesyltransferase [Tropilaelaps mercedesae]|uniref:Heme O synthase n=1 Tax=Tropilaelaps mercedesae TaxID=418985 RepID=A0A1V9XVX6_9ACAR|nr:protoheme IX farnesyltransferase [Tropilaelaps mercedesae]